ncbi:unnamed protein product [Cuscuta epithymum]|uniref:Uncharacterized protein n=1 Tax=Cuscuta epithymum TaxID=186058 RepID=A0AAV0FTA9_9ASTE|nr:unnamed protein product [Cuscuta epithymum]
MVTWFHNGIQRRRIITNGDFIIDDSRALELPTHDDTSISHGEEDSETIEEGSPPIAKVEEYRRSWWHLCNIL